MLRVKIGTTGYHMHIQEIANKGKQALMELQRFSTFPRKIKLHLVKAFIRQLITYAPIPSVTVRNTNIKKLQFIINRGLRFAYDGRYPYSRDTKTLHEISNFEPINYTTHMQACKVFNKVNELDHQFTTLMEDYEKGKKHFWFRKTIN